MIYKLSGILIEKKPDFLALDVKGIAFAISIPLTTYNKLPPLDSEYTLFTHLIHKEDKMELYGFHEKESLDFFKILLKLSGVGPKLALILLSNLTPGDLHHIVETKNIDRLKRINGVGPKKAEKIIFELKGKVHTMSESISDNAEQNINEEVILALSSLGYSNKEAQNVLNKPEVIHASSLEDKLKSALQILNKG